MEQTCKGLCKAGGISLVAAGAVLFLFFAALAILQTSPTLTPEMILNDPVPSVSLYALTVSGELLLMPGVLGLYAALKNTKKAHMTIGTALWLLAVISFLISRTQIISLFRMSASYQATTSESLKATYLVLAEHTIELSNVFANIALMLLGIASIIIGLVMLKGFFGRNFSYLVVISGTLTLLGAIGVIFEPIAILVLFGLTLGAIWQILAGIKLFNLGR
jgi:hypothetical protein